MANQLLFNSLSSHIRWIDQAAMKPNGTLHQLM